ncbi:hypothetical protein Nepgr_019164 [Nepenthes gracilis]|uniref:NAC domain-containing protein n=1 Tax=Nepenthes gracilis TaxID=150966 RepID=A0AAD3XU43_NEPGR|nr:hypothetical protein Nepgr_019164 [Nepenthes gracilis]
MPEIMSIFVNGQSRVPPGFRFHPTEEELLLYYLKKKVAYQAIDLDVICEVDLNKLEPWDIQEKCKIGSTPQNDWYFFSHKDKKYPTGTRTNRATAAGFWKATGRDKMIYSSGGRIGMRKTLVFYKGRAPHGHKSDWIMHEYRLDEKNTSSKINVCNEMGGDIQQEEGWVVCRIFTKKNHHRSHPHRDGPTIAHTETTAIQYSSSDEGALEQILRKPRKGGRRPTSSPRATHPVDPTMISPANSPLDGHMTLPGLQEGPNPAGRQAKACYQPPRADILRRIEKEAMGGDPNSVYDDSGGDTAEFCDWTVLDRLLATHLNCQNIGETSEQLARSFDNQAVAFGSPSDHGDHHNLQVQEIISSASNGATLDCSCEIDLWSFSRSSLMADALCHASDTHI